MKAQKAENVEYKIGEHLAFENGKLQIKSSTTKLIKIARSEVKKWETFLENLLRSENAK